MTSGMDPTRAGICTLGLVLLTVVPLLRADCSGFYQRKIQDLCLEPFHQNLSGLDPTLWCSWPHTLPLYEGLTNCTFQVAFRLGCYWPNQVVDAFFTDVHRRYFHACAATGRLLQDPPLSVLAPVIALPLLVTLLVTSLVVWRSKRSEGIL